MYITNYTFSALKIANQSCIINVDFVLVLWAVGNKMNYLFDMKKVYMIIIVNIINTVVHLLKYLKNTNCWNWAIHKKDKLCYKSIKYLQLNLTTLNRDL